MDIGPSDEPFTVAEARDYVAELIELAGDRPASEVLPLVAGVLEHIRCTCSAAEVLLVDQPIAPVLQLRPDRPSVN